MISVRGLSQGGRILLASLRSVTMAKLYLVLLSLTMLSSLFITADASPGDNKSQLFMSMNVKIILVVLSAPVAEPDPRDYIVIPMEYFAEDEDYTAPMFRSAAEEVTVYLI